MAPDLNVLLLKVALTEKQDMRLWGLLASNIYIYIDASVEEGGMINFVSIIQLEG